MWAITYNSEFDDKFGLLAGDQIMQRWSGEEETQNRFWALWVGIDSLSLRDTWGRMLL
jgi:hypothetical protein